MTNLDASLPATPAQVWLERGQQLMEAGWEEEARVAFTRALSLDPSLRAAYQALAMLYDPVTGPPPPRKEQGLTIDELLQDG